MASSFLAAMVLPEPDFEAVGRCLARLQPHLRPQATALTGGVAVQLHLLRAGRPGRRLRFNDIDLVALEPSAVLPSIAAEFLISHYHVPHAGYAKFLIQVADPVTRLRVDVFGRSPGTSFDTEPVTVGEIGTAILPARHILREKLRLLDAASPEHPVDPKHYQDAVQLADLLGDARPSVNPRLLVHDRYEMNLNARCPRCQASARSAFPLASKQSIFDILGYV